MERLDYNDQLQMDRHCQMLSCYCDWKCWQFIDSVIFLTGSAWKVKWTWVSDVNFATTLLVEEKVSCEPLIQSEIDSSVTPISALFSWWFLRNWFISPLVHKTKTPLNKNNWSRDPLYWIRVMQSKESNSVYWV